MSHSASGLFLRYVPCEHLILGRHPSCAVSWEGPFSWCSTLFTFAQSFVPDYRQSNRGNEMCDNEMSFSMMPQLSIKKTRFAKASLRTRYARHRSWGATCRLPNRRAGTLTYPMVALVVELSQWMRGSSSFPIRPRDDLHYLLVPIHGQAVSPSARVLAVTDRQLHESGWFFKVSWRRSIPDRSRWWTMLLRFLTDR